MFHINIYTFGKLKLGRQQSCTDTCSRILSAAFYSSAGCQASLSRGLWCWWWYWLAWNQRSEQSVVSSIQNIAKLAGQLEQKPSQKLIQQAPTNKSSHWRLIFAYLPSTVSLYWFLPQLNIMTWPTTAKPPVVLERIVGKSDVGTVQECGLQCHRRSGWRECCHRDQSSHWS